MDLARLRKSSSVWCSLWQHTSECSNFHVIPTHWTTDISQHDGGYLSVYLSQGQDPTRLIALSNNNANFAFFSIFCAVPVVFTLDCNMFFCLYSSFHATHYTTLQLFVTYFCAFISGVNSRTHYQNVIQKLPHNLAEELAKCFCQWHRS